MAFLSAINEALSPLWEKFICRFQQRFDQHVNVAFNIDAGRGEGDAFIGAAGGGRGRGRTAGMRTDCKVMCNAVAQ